MNHEQTQAVRLLQTAKGQVEATLKMLDENRYCIDVVNQIAATQALLKKANTLILKQHVDHCVKEAIEEGNVTEKLDEIQRVISRLG